MKKQDIIGIIEKLPVAMREQLADEIYQSLNSSDSNLNADWIIEANHLMRRLENTPPAIPEEFLDNETKEPPKDLGKDTQTENLLELIDEIRLHCTIRARTKSMEKGEGIPGEQVSRELREHRKQREKLLGDLEVSAGPVPGVAAVEPLSDFKLLLIFEGGEERIIDLESYRRGIFSKLQDSDYFSWVRVYWGGIRWPHGEQLYPKMLYGSSIPKDE